MKKNKINSDEIDVELFAGDVILLLEYVEFFAPKIYLNQIWIVKWKGESWNLTSKALMELAISEENKKTTPSSFSSSQAK